MNEFQMQQACESMLFRMQGKGLTKASASISFKSGEEPSAYISYKAMPGENFLGGDKWEFQRGKTPAEAIRKMNAWIDKQPSPEDRKREEFTKALAVAIELGKANGIEDLHVNPLIEAMNRLSENALTHQPEA